MKAVWVQGKTQTVREFPIPTTGPAQVLIKVICAAQNPRIGRVQTHCNGIDNSGRALGWTWRN